MTRAFYATGNNKIPLILNASSSLLIVGMAYLFTYIFNVNDTFRYFAETLLRVDDLSGVSVLMLPFAYSVGMVINAILLIVYIERNVKGFWLSIQKTLVHAFSVAVIMGLVAYYMLQLTSNFVDQSTLFGILIQGGLRVLFQFWLECSSLL